MFARGKDGFAFLLPDLGDTDRIPILLDSNPVIMSGGWDEKRTSEISSAERESTLANIVIHVFANNVASCKAFSI